MKDTYNYLLIGSSYAESIHPQKMNLRKMGFEIMKIQEHIMAFVKRISLFLVMRFFICCL